MVKIQNPINLLLIVLIAFTLMLAFGSTIFLFFISGTIMQYIIFWSIPLALIIALVIFNIVRVISRSKARKKYKF